MWILSVHGCGFYAVWLWEHDWLRGLVWDRNGTNMLAGTLSWLCGCALWFTSLEFVRRKYFEVRSSAWRCPFLYHQSPQCENMSKLLHRFQTLSLDGRPHCHERLCSLIAQAFLLVFHIPSSVAWISFLAMPKNSVIDLVFCVRMAALLQDPHPRLSGLHAVRLHAPCQPLGLHHARSVKSSSQFSTYFSLNLPRCNTDLLHCTSYLIHTSL